MYPTLEVSNRVCRLSELIKDYCMDQTCSRFWNRFSKRHVTIDILGNFVKMIFWIRTDLLKFQDFGHGQFQLVSLARNLSSVHSCLDSHRPPSPVLHLLGCRRHMGHVHYYFLIVHHSFSGSSSLVSGLIFVQALSEISKLKKKYKKFLRAFCGKRSFGGIWGQTRSIWDIFTESAHFEIFL